MTPTQQAALEQAARECVAKGLGQNHVCPSLIDEIVKALAAQRAAVLEEVAQMGQDFISTVYPNSPSHAKGATEILKLISRQA